MNGNSETFVGSEPSRSITLTMRQGPNPGQRFTVDKESIGIGRSGTVVCGGGRVSIRMHLVPFHRKTLPVRE